MAYLPEYGVGYFYSINSGNGAAFGKIGDTIRAYVTRRLTRQTVPTPGVLPRTRGSMPVGMNRLRPASRCSTFSNV
jgi:hypothetical protein